MPGFEARSCSACLSPPCSHHTLDTAVKRPTRLGVTQTVCIHDNVHEYYDALALMCVGHFYAAWLVYKFEVLTKRASCDTKPDRRVLKLRLCVLKSAWHRNKWTEIVPIPGSVAGTHHCESQRYSRHAARFRCSMSADHESLPRFLCDVCATRPVSTSGNFPVSVNKCWMLNV